MLKPPWGATWTLSRNALTGINRILTERIIEDVADILGGRNALTGINRILTGYTNFPPSEDRFES